MRRRGECVGGPRLGVKGDLARFRSLIDDPAFVRRMGQFVRAHRRTELLSYFESAPGSLFDLATKPRSRAAYRAAITTLG